MKGDSGSIVEHRTRSPVAESSVNVTGVNAGSRPTDRRRSHAGVRSASWLPVAARVVQQPIGQTDEPIGHPFYTGGIDVVDQPRQFFRVVENEPDVIV